MGLAKAGDCLPIAEGLQILILLTDNGPENLMKIGYFHE